MKWILFFATLSMLYIFFVYNQDMQEKLISSQNYSAELQQEITRLKTETSSLKENTAQLEEKNKKLEEQVAELSETEQNKFSKASDLLGNAKSASDYRKAEEAFASFITKYPNSQYLEQAKKMQDDSRKSADHLEWLDKKRGLIQKQISDKDWDAAAKTVQQLSKYISKEEHDGYNKTINEEKNKPIKTTLANIVTYMNKYDEKRVEFVATCRAISLKEKYLEVEDSGVGNIKVKYGGQENLISRFANNPSCGEVKIVGEFIHYVPNAMSMALGETLFPYTGSLDYAVERFWIEAETIEDYETDDEFSVSLD